MIATDTAVRTLGSFVNGKWDDGAGRHLHPVTNPATGAVIAQAAYATVEDVDRTAKAAHAAFLQWRDVPVVDRVQVLYRYKALLEKNTEDLARTLTVENGKVFDDARVEIRSAAATNAGRAAASTPCVFRYARRVSARS